MSPAEAVTPRSARGIGTFASVGRQPGQTIADESQHNCVSMIYNTGIFGDPVGGAGVEPRRRVLSPCLEGSTAGRRRSGTGGAARGANGVVDSVAEGD
jgi:hypothetical protein